MSLTHAQGGTGGAAGRGACRPLGGLDQRARRHGGETELGAGRVSVPVCVQVSDCDSSCFVRDTITSPFY